MSELPDRRRFLRAVGLAGLSSAVIPALSLAQSPAPGAAPHPGAAAAPDTTAAPKKEEISEDAKALAGILKRRYKHLTDEQVASIAEDLDGDLKALPRLYSVKLANGDEPDVTFRA